MLGLSITWTAVAAVILLASVILHEAAHAGAMRRNGIAISEFGLGLGARPRIVLKPSRRHSFRISLSLVLLGAYVTPADPKAVDALPYREGAWCEGAGIVANIVIAEVLTLAYFAVHGSAAASLAAAAVTAVTWLLRRQVARYAVPVLALPSTALVVGGTILSFATHQAGGPAGTVALLHSSSGSQALTVGILVNISLAALNMIPFFPLDGGRIAKRVLGRWLGGRGETAFIIGSFAGFVLIIGAAILTDVLHFI